MKTGLIVLTALMGQVALAEPHSIGSNAGRRAKERQQYREHTIKSDGIQIRVKDGCLDESRQSLLNALNDGKDVPFNELTDQLIRIHQKHSMETDPSKRTSLDRMDQVLGNIRTGIQSQDPNEIKVAYEKALEKLLGKSILYNKDATSLSDVCSGKLQCYSGTVLNQVITRKLLSRDLFMQHNPVVIYEKSPQGVGHVLPGYLIKTSDGKFHMYGIETTAEGLAKIDYGMTDALRGDIKVVKAEHWILSEVFKDCLEQPQNFAVSLLNKASEDYQFDLTQQITFASSTSSGTSPSSEATNPLNASPFSMGTKASTREGDIKRARIDTQPRSNGIPNVTEQNGVRVGERPIEVEVERSYFYFDKEGERIV